MSIIGEKEQYVSKDEIIEYLKKKISELEEELRVLKTLLASLDPESVAPEEKFDPTERLEDVKYGRRPIAKVAVGGDYIRIRFKFPGFMPDDVKVYLESVIEEIANKQGIDGIPPEERATMDIRTNPDGSIREIRVVNLSSTLEKVKVKAALKYVAELMYQLYRKRGKE